MVMNQIYSRKGTSQVSATSINLPGLAGWLTELTRPAVGKTTTETNIEIAMLGAKLTYNDPIENKDDEALSCLSGWLTNLGLDARQIIVTSDTVNFNIHHTDDYLNELDVNGALQLYNVTDFDYGICWTWDPSASSTRGVIWYRSDFGRRQAGYILNGLIRPGLTYNHRLLPGLLALQSGGCVMRDWIDGEAKAISVLQIQTGHHYRDDARFDRPDEVRDVTPDLQTMDLALMTRSICGLAVNITSSAVCLQRFVRLADFILDEAAEDNQFQQASLIDVVEVRRVLELNHAIIQRTRSAKRYIEGLLDEAQAWKHKANIVVQTLLSLTTQRDQNISIGIAEDSRILARKATRDSTSMKAIAAVTVFFLPGTFVSSLFAMPMFNWDADSGSSLNQHFWIYWVVTLPLTAAAIATWLAWSNKDLFEGAVRQRSKLLVKGQDV